MEVVTRDDADALFAAVAYSHLILRLEAGLAIRTTTGKEGLVLQQQGRS